MTTFSQLDLNPKILSALEKKGYTHPTPIQEQAIPHLLEGKDLLGIAQTGTGKTAAFSLPILNNLSKSDKRVKPNQIRTLILTPTRELASQIADNIAGYGKELNLRHGVIFGGVAIGPQIRMMSQGLDILIATPGRLLDLMTQGHIRYANLEIFVLDEADRMLDMGFIHDVKKIIKKLPDDRQTLFFSATMPEDIANLADSILTNPINVEVTPQATTVDRIDQKINFVAKGNKNLLLKKILQQDDAETVLVFSKTKHGANRIVQFLETNDIKAAAIHGNKSQGAREKALSGFRSGDLKVLVATDIAARGIDVPGISHVINFDIPIDPESYVHRIGRTARAGKEGVAITFCDPSEKSLLRAVEKVINYQIPVDDTHPLHGVEASAAYAGKSDFGPRFTNADRSRAKARGESSRAANQRRNGAQGDEELGERKPAFKSKFGENGKRLNKDASRFSSGRPKGDARFDGRTNDSRNKKPRSDDGFGGNAFDRPKRGASFGNSDEARFDRPRRDGRFGKPRSESGFGGNVDGNRADSRGRGNRSKDRGNSGEDVYISAKDAIKEGGKGKNFSYAGVREKKFGGKKKPFSRKKY